MTSFVILHYNSIVDTIRCVDSILLNVSHESISIVIVDNNSQNNTGIELIEKYKSEKIVTVILNSKNEGFSKGNNIGCEYAIKTCNPDFICVLNNDTYIDDVSFIKKIYETYNQNAFDALGPKIWNIKRQYNQNPFNVISSLEEANNAILFNQKAAKFLNSIAPLTYYIYCKYFFKSNHFKEYSLFGAAIVFSKKYYTFFAKIFPENSFMYGEENFLNYRRIKYNLNFVFDFNITVFHNHSASTKNLSKSIIKKWRFQHENILKALIKLQDIYIYKKDI